MPIYPDGRRCFGDRVEWIARDAIGPVFFGVQNMLNAAANLSKAFWGQARSKSKEREALRQSLGVDDTSPLRTVTMRNNFEHFDERLDEWWAQSKQHNYVDRFLGMPPMGVQEIDAFRIFIPDTAEVWFWRQNFDLGAIVTEARRLLPLAKQEGSKPYPGKAGHP